jgi:hypothetical protein
MPSLTQNTKRWIKGMAKAAGHGVGQGLVGYTAGAQLRHILTAMGAAIVISVGFFLSENPLPPDADDGPKAAV